MNIAVLGPEGTFSHELACRLFHGNILLVPTIKGIFALVENGEADGLVPLENSETGGIGPTLDGLMHSRVFICAEIDLPIRHHLVSFEDPKDLRVLYVHPQTHEQCSEFIERLGIPVIHTSSNAASAREMKEVAYSGAITSRTAADRYHVPVREENVQNNPDNVTRFVLISARKPDIEAPRKCSMILDPLTDRAGLLYDLLGVFAQRGINLTRIESRPAKRGMGRYVFFIDCETPPDYPGLISDLDRMAQVKNLGCYRTMEVP
jgi:prephenate dehydratase